MRAAPPAVALRSEAGRRPVNEDAVLHRVLPDGRELLALADGMGGHAAGEVASHAALEALAGALAAGAGLLEAMAAANGAVWELGCRTPSARGMGTTLVALLRDGGAYEVANVGDSRAYRLTAGGIEPVTRDHSFVAEAVGSGLLSLEDALRSPWRGTLTRALGTGPSVTVDRFGPFPATPPQTVVLCSDGLCRFVPDGEIHRLVGEAPGAPAAAERLVAAALAAGSDDNVSVAIHAFAPGVEREFGVLPEPGRRAAARGPAPGTEAPTPSAPATPRPAPAGRPAPATAVRSRPRAAGARRRAPSPELLDRLLFTTCTGALLLWLAVVLGSL